MTDIYRQSAAPVVVPAPRSWWCRHGFHAWSTHCTSYNDFRTVDKYCVNCDEKQKGKPSHWLWSGGGS